MGSLAAAHKGYFYQDIVTAYFLARSLVEPVRSTMVDAKLHGDDRFDDLLITADDGNCHSLVWEPKPFNPQIGRAHV